MLNRLPPEIISYICQYLKLNDMANISACDSYMYQAISDDSFYAVCKMNSWKLYDIALFTKSLVSNFNYCRRFLLIFMGTDNFLKSCQGFSHSKYSDSRCYKCGSTDFWVILKCLCGHGDLVLCQWFYQKCSIFHVYDFCELDEKKCITKACKKQHPDIIAWLIKLSHYQKLIRSYTFSTLVFYGNIKLLNMLKEIYNTDNCLSNDDITEALIKLCVRSSYNPTRTLEWMRHNYGTLVKQNAEACFGSACFANKLEILQYLKVAYPEINIRQHNDYYFRIACERGFLNVAMWLIKTEPTINVHVYNEWPFRRACREGHLKVAQWLLGEEPNINITERNSYAYRWANKNNHFNVVRWLKNIHPNIDRSLN